MTRVRLLMLPLFSLLGCTASSPIRAWQQELTDYTNRHGNGDINILRESSELRSPQSLRPAQVRFDHQDVSASGMGFLDARFDVRGVLVGQHVVGGNPTFFFLVGVVKRPVGNRSAQLEDIRIISCSVQQSHHAWKVSHPDPASLQKYLARAASGADGSRPTEARETFPRVSDDFQFDVRAGVAQIVESRSGAQWLLPLH